MAKRGPKPTPTPLLKLRGSYRPNRHDNRANEPKPVASRPTCPSWLKGDARRAWNTLAPELSRLGLLTRLDVQLFTALCLEWGLYVGAAKKLSNVTACITTTSNGNEIQHALVGIKNKTLANVTQLASLFGLDPSSRTRLRVNPSDEPDLQALLAEVVANEKRRHA